MPPTIPHSTRVDKSASTIYRMYRISCGLPRSAFDWLHREILLHYNQESRTDRQAQGLLKTLSITNQSCLKQNRQLSRRSTDSLVVPLLAEPPTSGITRTGGQLRQRFLGETIAVLLALALGYGGIAVGQRLASDSATPVVRSVPARPTPTIAPAVTFTPVPSAIQTAQAASLNASTATPKATAPSRTPTSLPTSPTPAPTPVVYVVQSGDTLEAISTKFGVSVDAIVTFNHLTDANQLAQGQKLRIPPK